MTKAKISEYSATAADNTDVNGVNIAEGCPPSSMNNMGREIMAALKRFQTGSDGDGVTVGGNLVVSGSTTANTLSATVLQSDTISEKTSAAGVTIDSVLLKDGLVGIGADGSASAPSIYRASDTNTGIFFPAADTIAFAEGGVEAMRIDSSGRVGISTSSPGNLLQVAGRIGATAAGGNTGINGAFLSYSSGAIFTSGSSSNVAGTYNPIVFTQDNQVGSAERMRIDSSGNLLVGTTSSAGKLTVRQTAGDTFTATFQNAQPNGSAGYGVRSQFTEWTPNSTGAFFFYGSDPTAVRFEVRSNGGIANYSANDVNLSDRREKTNFAPAKNYLETICAIPVQTFNYIDQNLEDDPGLTLGVIAQDVQEVAPELVMESNWGTQDEPKMRLSIYQTDLQYALMKCIQELKAELDTVKAELATLKGN